MTVTVTDDDGGVGETTATVIVANVAPAGSLGNDGPVDEGSQASVSFSGQSDPSADDTAAGFTYSFDFGNDGSFEVLDKKRMAANTGAKEEDEDEEEEMSS